MPASSDAEAIEVPATRSDWGRSRTLAIGERAPDFTLPDVNGKELSGAVRAKLQ